MSEEMMEEMEADLERTVATQKAVIAGVYTERNHLVALCAKLAEVGRASGNNEYGAWLGWDDNEPEEWATVVYVKVGNRQMSWHIPSVERSLFDFLSIDPEQVYDGHSTEQKYDRLREILRLPIAPRPFALPGD